MTTNVDGKPKTVKQASTTVNDNGKITTYTAKYPWKYIYKPYF